MIEANPAGWMALIVIAVGAVIATIRVVNFIASYLNDQTEGGDRP